MSSRLCAEQHVERIHRRVEPRFQHRNLRVDLRQRPFDLAHLQLGGYSFLVLKLDDGEELATRCGLLSGNRDSRLQPANRDVHIGRLSSHRELRRDCAGRGCLVVRARRLSSAPQSAEDIELPTRPEVGFVIVAAAIEIG